MLQIIRECCGAQARRGVAVIGMLLASVLCGCQGNGGSGFSSSFGGGSRTTVLLGAKTLDPNVPLTPISVRATRESEDSKRGVVYLGRGDYGRAARAFERALEVDPGDHNSVFLAGLAYEKIGDQSKACSRYTEAARIVYRSEYLDGESRACGEYDRG